jgi:hypothetical protein
MDHKTKLFEVYTTTLLNILDENSERFDDTTNRQEQWGANGAFTHLMNMVTTL